LRIKLVAAMDIREHQIRKQANDELIRHAQAPIEAKAYIAVTGSGRHKGRRPPLTVAGGGAYLERETKVD
jgi:hypothetical protein